MKKYCSLLLFFLTGSLAYAQPDTLFRNRTMRFQVQAGINATEFIKQFVVFNSNTLPSLSPYDFNLKLMTGIRQAPRLLAGPRLGYGYRNTYTHSNNDRQDNERSDEDHSRSLRAGIELQHIIGRRLVLFYGIDYINNRSEQITVTSFPLPAGGTGRSEIITSNRTYGYGPLIGVQFNINRWINLHTETSFYLLESRGGTRSFSSNPNNFTSETFTRSRSRSITLPLFINCNLMF